MHYHYADDIIAAVNRRSHRDGGSFEHRCEAFCCDGFAAEGIGYDGLGALRQVFIVYRVVACCENFKSVVDYPCVGNIGVGKHLEIGGKIDYTSAVRGGKIA